MTQPDMLRGTPIDKWTGLTQESVCECGHKFGIHVTYTYRASIRYRKRCQFCACQDFTLNNFSGDYMPDINRKIEQSGFEMAQAWAKVFIVRDNVEYQQKVALGMVFANQQGLNLENGAAFINGFVSGLTNSEAVAKHMSMEDKINLLLERELERRLDSPKNETSG